MTASIGHNSVAGEQLRSIADRIERLEEEKKGIADDIKGIYTEAKSAGFDVKVLRKIIALRKMDRASLADMLSVMDIYMHALGMTPQQAAEAAGIMD